MPAPSVRDEATTIQLAVAPQFSTMWAWLSRDSFPALFASLLRLWIIAGPGERMRASVCLERWSLWESLSLCLPVVGCLPAACRCWRCRWSRSTLTYSISAVHWRAYGLGLLLIMLCYAAFWRLARNPTLRNVAASLVLAVLSVHTNYQNTYLLLGIGMAGASVCALCRLWKRSTLILGLCFVAGSLDADICACNYGKPRRT